MRDSTPPHGDAFGFTADPAAYCPRAAFESALSELAELIHAGPACAALVGEPGLGKTLLLHVLKERLAGPFECLYVPFPRLDPAELWSWVAAALGGARSEDPRAAVVEYARRRREEGVGLVLLVDDADALPRETRRVLMLAARSSVFSLVMALNSEDRTSLDELPASVRRIDLGPPLTLAETHAYVRVRLRRVDPDGAIAARLGPEQMADLHAASAGVPALLHAMLDAWLRGAAIEARPRPAAVAPTPAPAAPVVAPVVAEPARPVEALPPPRSPDVPPRPFFRRHRTRRAPAVFATLLVIGAVAFWRSTTTDGPAPVPSEPVEPLAPAEVTEAPAEAAEVLADAAVPEATEPPAAAPPLEPAETPPVETALAETPEPPEPPPVEALPAPVPSETAEPRGPAEATEAPTAAAREASEPPAAAPPPEPAQTPPVEIAVAEAPEPPPPEPAAPPPPEPQLAPPPGGPRLSVNAEPWALIQLDGKPVGETPLGELPLSPGPHRVSATLPDGRVLERNVEAQSGDVYVLFP